MVHGMTDSRLANIGANAICDSFDEHQTTFKAITRRAQGRFERCDWKGNAADAADRLELYKTTVDQIVDDVRALLSGRDQDKWIWASMKAVYSGLIAGRDDWELAETFFNSVTRRIFSTVGVDPQIEFVDTDFDTPPNPASFPVFKRYDVDGGLPGVIGAILRDYRFRTPYQDAGRDAALVAERVDAFLAGHSEIPSPEAIEMAKPVFYRGWGAYLVGRMRPGNSYVPFVVALLNDSRGIYVDAVLLEEDDVSHLFGFTRSYFHVQAERPYDLTHFIKSLLPRKRIAELYISIGYNKHGKTELYRDLLNHLAQKQDKFEIARGERGMVMCVFTMPSYDVVFKVIRDEFRDPKVTSRSEVMDKYRLVFKHDRAGRLVDAQEFEHLQFRKDRFSEQLLEELVRTAGSTVEVNEDLVHIRHLYVERRLTPLNLYLRESGPSDSEAAVVDYGNCVRNLAEANIFPGDLLLKNFGVTRHGRVVFYDYDELTLLTDCSFRALPAAREDEEFSDEPWFYVGPHDFFPEEFRRWLGLAPEWREVFMRHHADLFDLDFWTRTQARLKAGEIIHIFPYPASRKLAPRPESSGDGAGLQRGQE